MKKILILFFAVFSFVNISVAQKSLYGTITNTAGQPLPYASIYIEDMQRGIVADENGKYIVPTFPAGNHMVRVSYIGYSTHNSLVMMNGKDIQHDFKLAEETMSLDELVILPKGMDFPTYIMRQLEKNIKPLKKRMASYDCTTTATLTKKIDLSDMHKRRTIRFAMLMMSWGKIFDIMVKYPDFSMTIAEDIHFSNGSQKNSKLRLIRTNPKLTDREIKSVMKKDWFLDKNPYDEFYDIVDKKISELKSRKSKYKVKYLGSYQENGKTILIVEYGKTHVEVVDGLWQIRRMRYKSGTRTISFEFQPLVSGVYLPTSGHAQYNIDYEGYPQGTVTMAMSLSYRNLKKK